jgi:hypothetical protein
MMTAEEAAIVKMVYCRFIENEDEGWSEIDDVLEILEYLTGEELVE